MTGVIFTLGRVDIYEPLFDGGDAPQKAGRESHYPGGSVWRTYEDATGYKTANRLDNFRVYGVVAVWDIDTAPNEREAWHDLLYDRDMVRV